MGRAKHTYALLVSLVALLLVLGLVSTGRAAGLSTEQSLRLTGFLSITCDEESDAYVFRVNNGLPQPIAFRVDLRCKNNDARNSVQLETLPAFGNTLTPITIKPSQGTVRNQECELHLVGPDLLLQGGGSDPSKDYTYASQVRLCGRSLFDGAFDDDDDSCNYFTCITTRNWWHNGLVYYIAHVFFIGLMLFVIVTLALNTMRNAKLMREQWSVAGTNPEQMREILKERRVELVMAEAKIWRAKQRAAANAAPVLMPSSSSSPRGRGGMDNSYGNAFQRKRGGALADRLFGDQHDKAADAVESATDIAKLRKAGAFFRNMLAGPTFGSSEFETLAQRSRTYGGKMYSTVAIGALAGHNIKPYSGSVESLWDNAESDATPRVCIEPDLHQDSLPSLADGYTDTARGMMGGATAQRSYVNPAPEMSDEEEYGAGVFGGAAIPVEHQAEHVETFDEQDHSGGSDTAISQRQQRSGGFV